MEKRSFAMKHFPSAVRIFGLTMASLVLCAVPVMSMAETAEGVRIHMVKPIAQRKILPDTPEEVLPREAAPKQGDIYVAACRGEFEPASFVIRSNRALTDVLVTATDLLGPGGAAIPKEEIDVRIVKCWFQAGETIVKGSTTLVPELLLKDASLIRVDVAAQTNYLKVLIDAQPQYIDISSSDAIFPAGAAILDAVGLRPFSVPADTNQQVWITLRVPPDAKTGLYTGQLLVSSGSERLATKSLVLEVLPFDLGPSVLEYSLYYRGRLSKTPGTVIGSEGKSTRQYTLELRNMKDHGVEYPVFYQPLNEMTGPALAIRKEIGLPSDKLYAIRVGTSEMERFDPDDLALLTAEIDQWKKLISQYGYGTLFVYGKDEAKAEVLVAQRPAWEAAHAAGAKVFVAGYKGAVDLVGDLLDLQVLSSTFKPDEVTKWHRLGKKVFIYGNPQVGVEDAAVYRRNYGIALLCNGYDGAMNYAYQHTFGGHIWNDFDDIHRETHFRDHVFAYPTSDGVIDTIQWEGFREAVDDVRYLSALAKADGASTYPAVCAMINTTEELDTVRRALIAKIMDATAGNLGSDPGVSDDIAVPERLRLLEQGTMMP
jgi:hypothetical protein